MPRNCDPVSVRPAEAADAMLIFSWRNDPTIRSVSRSPGELEWDAHVAWLEVVLSDPARLIFIGESQSRPIGVVRFDCESEVHGEVSLYLAPYLQGQGLGRHLLCAGEEAAELEIINATIRESNRRSQKLFQRCGYRQIAPERWRKEVEGP